MIFSLSSIYRNNFSFFALTADASRETLLSDSRSFKYFSSTLFLPYIKPANSNYLLVISSLASWSCVTSMQGGVCVWWGIPVFPVSSCWSSPSSPFVCGGRFWRRFRTCPACCGCDASNPPEIYHSGCFWLIQWWMNTCSIVFNPPPRRPSMRSVESHRHSSLLYALISYRFSTFWKDSLLVPCIYECWRWDWRWRISFPAGS